MRDPRSTVPTFGRRRVLQAAAAAALIACGAAAAAVRTSGYAVPAGRRLVALRAWQFVVVQQVAARITAPDHASAPSADDVDVVGFVDDYMAQASGAIRRDVGRLLACIEHLAPLGVGLVARFSRLGPAAQDRVLESLESSSNDLLRAGFEGIKALVFMGYYRDPRTWSIVSYDGPLVGRPPGGTWR
jgi:hypothetical protein